MPKGEEAKPAKKEGSVDTLPQESESQVVPADGSSSSKKTTRRRFIKAILTVAALATLGGYALSRYISTRGAGPSLARQLVMVDDSSPYGTAAGRKVNVSDLTTFPPNSHWVITYPSSGDSKVDAQAVDTFRKFELIRLPVELGGDKPAASSFVAFSKLCVHLECSPNYNPTQNVNPTENGYESGPGYTTHQNFECPCHGTTYRIPDGLAVDGPASRQPPPTNAVPMLTLSADDQGYLRVEPPIWDVNHNGKLGYGRYVSA